MTRKRQDVALADCWNVEALYPTSEAWQKEFEKGADHAHKPQWPQLAVFKGRLGESPETLKAALETQLAIVRQLHKLYVYMHLRHDEELTDDGYKRTHMQATTLLHDFAQESAWFEPELLALPDKRLQQLIHSPVLADYRFHLEKIVRIKPHLLPADQEELLARASKALEVSHKTFSAINDADFKFGSIQNSKEETLPLTHGTYGLYTRDYDRTLRKNAFTHMHAKYHEYEHTLGELLNGTVQAHLFNARSRHYLTCLDAALFPHNIDPSVYHALINAVHTGIHTLHRYVRLRSRLLKIDHLHLYDMYVPLIPDIDIQMSYPEAEQIVIESVAPLGKEYQDTLRKGFLEQRWVDRYENQNKRSGAYSSGCYDSMPYILMNYKNQLRDVFTLAHEAGHSMHSLLSHKNQPFHYSDYSIFLAEVASTFNEDLLMRLLVQRAKTKEEKIFLINQKIEDIRLTLFRQTMFAEFELWMHTTAEKNIPLTPTLLKEKFRQLNAFYFGPTVELDSLGDVEWARIPHFYYNFYVYQYATGVSAALALSDKVVNGGEAERDAYLGFLKAGNSRYPIEILQRAGVDMQTPAPVEATIAKFEKLVEELERLLAI